MALPTVPAGYSNWNDYIETEAPALALAQGITLQEAKASLKLLMVSKPIRSAVGEPYYRIYNEFTTWANRALLPDQGRPWKLDVPEFYVLDSNGNAFTVSTGIRNSENNVFTAPIIVLDSDGNQYTVLNT